MNTNYGIDELSTRSLNQDCLENFFGVIRIKNFNNIRPDPLSFRSAYRSVCLNHLLNAPDKSNCEADYGFNLLQFTDFAKLDVMNSIAAEEPTEIIHLNTNLDEYDVSQLHNIQYTAGWIIGAIAHHSCLERIQSEGSSSVSLLARHKNAKNENNYFELTNFVASVLSIFNNNFERLLKISTVGIKSKLQQLVKQTQTCTIICEKCCEVVSDKYLNMLFKGKIKALNESLKKKSNVNRKNTSGIEKAKKLNII